MAPAPKTFLPKNLFSHRLILPLALLGFMILVMLYGSVNEDAYITFRVVDNFVHGHGLRWNIHERVQAYTNPLWMLLHIPFYALWENIYIITLALSLVCTFSALVVTMRTFRRAWPATVGLFLLPLATSSSFINYATSGLENPLAYLLYACFGWALLRSNHKYHWFFLSFTCALSLVNRLDTALLYLPVITYLVISRFNTVRWRQCFLGSLPIVGWELFSLFYYGFLFPNTKYAKLGSGIAQWDYVRQGFHYLLNLFALDFMAAIWMTAAGVLIPLAWLLNHRLRILIPTSLVCLAAGILLYVLYIISVGGNHVSGRFWALPIFASVWWVYAISKNYISGRVCLIIGTALVVIRLLYPSVSALHQSCRSCFIKINPISGQINVIVWTRGTQLSPNYVKGIGFCPGCFAKRKTINVWAPRNDFKRFPPLPPQIRTMIGMYGYNSSPDTLIVDVYGLSDPLLARLPSQKGWEFIGHMRRRIPEGYIHALQTDSLQKMDPHLAEYYSKLRLIVSGDLWSGERITGIIKFNLGWYDEALKRYLDKARHPISRLQNPSGQSIKSTAL